MDLSQFQQKDKFLMLALDQRSSFKKLLNTEDKEIIKEEKRGIIEALRDQFSGVLLDPQYGLPVYQNKEKPFLLCVEKSGFKEDNGERFNEEEYSVEQLKNLGASGVKLLLNFNPHLPRAQEQVALAKKISDEAKGFELPFFLEVVTYGDGEKGQLIQDSIISLLGGEVTADVFKLEFPGDTFNCRKISEMLGETPWILLSAGEDFETFKSKLIDASQNGASGFLAGRALWQESLKLQGEAKEKFLASTLKERFKEISEIVLAK